MNKQTSIAETLASAFAQLEAGRVADARKLARQLAKHEPKPAGLPYLEGLLAIESGDGVKAARHLARALAATPDAPPLLLAMARAQSLQGRDAEAETFYRRLLGLAPGAAAGRIELAALITKRGIVKRDAGEPEAAAALFEEATGFDPESLIAHSLLARVSEALGQTERAIAAHRRVVALDSADRYGAAVSLARLGAGPVPDKSTDAFVRGLFNEYAEKFDTDLVVKLDYRAPDLIAGAIRKALGAGPFDAFDAGCGTGLMGAALRPIARKLVGSDLSPRMVDRASARGVYDIVIAGDMIDELHASRGSFDLVTAADVLVYVGDLAPMFEAVAVALRPGGGFAFSVERGAGESWTLLETKRFAHSAAYLRKLAAEHGFTVLLLDEETTRTDRGAPVPGLVCVLKKAG